MGRPQLFVEPAARRRRWLWPNLGVLLFLLSLAGIYGGDSNFLTDPATARHLVAGKLAWTQGPVLATDPYTFTLAGQPWMQHQWLFDLTVGGLELAGGVPLAFVFGVVLFALAPLALWRLLAGEGVPWPVGLLYVCFAVVLLHAHWLLRPQLLNYVLLPVFIAAWYRYPRGLSPASWAVLLVLLVLWTNVHGGFVTALLFWGLAWTGRLVDNALAKRRVLDDPARRWAVFGAVAGLVTLLNPFGGALHGQIWRMVFQIESYAFYHEYQRLDFASGDPLAFGYLLLVALLIASRFLPGRGPLGWESVLPLVVFAYFAVTSQRHVLLLLLVAAVPLCRAWGGFLLHVMSGPQRERVLGVTRFERASRSHLWQVPLLAAVLALPFLATPIAGELRVGERNLSPEAVAWLKANREQVRRPLTTTWNGGPLAYHLGPDFKISYDDRNEFHGDARLNDLITLLEARHGWRELLRREGFDSVIVEPGRKLVYKLRGRRGWLQVHEDETVVIFVRVSGER
ncbi:MAG: hypothetical protein AAGK14_02450 [Verrucomicrobiota bacterium]